MNRSTLAFSFLITITLATVSLPQDNESVERLADRQGPKNSTKIDEFGPQGECAFSARVDNFFIQLHNNPEATGYVITYNGTDFLPSDYKASPMADRIHKAIAFRKYDDSHVVFINGGFRESGMTEFYLVPVGGLVPEPSKTVPEPERPKGTFMWSRSYLGGDDDQEIAEFILPEVKAKIAEERRLSEIQYAVDAGADADPADLVNQEEQPAEPNDEELSPEETQDAKFDWVKESFGPEVAKLKNGHGVMIVYFDDQHYDPSKLQRFVEEGRNRLAASAKIGSDRIQVLYGGYRGEPTVEYYLVPKGGKPPEAKPEERKLETTEDQSDNSSDH